jgi:hypothetical protein
MLTQGDNKSTGADATNAAAFSFAKSIATGSWGTLTIKNELDAEVAQAQSGISVFPNANPKLNVGDFVNYRILPPPRKKR